MDNAKDAAGVMGFATLYPFYVCCAVSAVPRDGLERIQPAPRNGWFSGATSSNFD